MEKIIAEMLNEPGGLGILSECLAILTEQHGVILGPADIQAALDAGAITKPELVGLSLLTGPAKISRESIPGAAQAAGFSGAGMLADHGECLSLRAPQCGAGISARGQ